VCATIDLAFLCVNDSPIRTLAAQKSETYKNVVFFNYCCKNLPCYFVLFPTVIPKTIEHCTVIPSTRIEEGYRAGLFKT
jgi:hypothetical protein